MLKYWALSLVFLTTACAQFDKQIVEAKKLIKDRNYSEAITLLESYEGSSGPKLLAEAYLKSGVEILKSKEMEKAERYRKAKSRFAEALKFDPNNETARDYYQMISKMNITEGIDT